MIFPRIMLVLMIAATIECVWNRKWNDFLYWLGAVILNLSIVLR